MLVECCNCGAPLDVREGVRLAKCAYCGRTNQIESLRTIALQRPENWQPPRTWTPPEHMPARSEPLPYRPSSPRGGYYVASAAIVVATALGIAGFQWWQVRARTSQPETQAQQAEPQAQQAPPQPVLQAAEPARKPPPEAVSSERHAASHAEHAPHTRVGPHVVHLRAELRGYPQRDPSPLQQGVLAPVLARLRACDERQPADYHDATILQEWILNVNEAGVVTDTDLGGDAGPPGAQDCEDAIMRGLRWPAGSSDQHFELVLRAK